jgi:hypothetical protein
MMSALTKLILKILNDLERKDYNLGSESGRQMIAEKISKGLSKGTSK